MAQLQRLAIAPTQFQLPYILLSREQRHYLCHVLRLREGDCFIALNGQGQGWLVQLKETLDQAQVIEPFSMDSELPVPVTLLAAPPKGNRFDQVVRGCTELGVARIVPLLSGRTVLNPSLGKLERWRRIAQEATEQSRRQTVPEIFAPLSMAQVLHQPEVAAPAPCLKYICVTQTTAPSLLHCVIPPPSIGILVMTGPEGGWTAAEQQEAMTAGYQPVSLGRRILPATTAPLAAIAVIAACLEASQLDSCAK